MSTSHVRTNSGPPLVRLSCQNSESPKSQDIARQLLALRAGNTPEPKTAPTSAQGHLPDLAHTPTDISYEGTASLAPDFAKAARCIQDAITLRKSTCQDMSCLEQGVQDALYQHMWPLVRPARVQFLRPGEYHDTRHFLQQIMFGIANEAVTQASMVAGEVDKNKAKVLQAYEETLRQEMEVVMEIGNALHREKRMNLELEEKLIILKSRNKVLEQPRRIRKNISRTLRLKKAPKHVWPGYRRVSQCVEERNFKVLFARVVLRCGVMDVSAVLRQFDKDHNQQTSYTWTPEEDPLNELAVRGLKLGSMSALGWVMHTGKTSPMFISLYSQLDSYFRGRYSPPTV